MLSDFDGGGAPDGLDFFPLGGALAEDYPANHPYLPEMKIQPGPEDARGRSIGYAIQQGNNIIHGWMLGFDAPGRVSSIQGHDLTVNLTYHPGTNRLASQTTHPNAGGNPPILTRQTNIDLLGRTYGVIHTAPDPESGNAPRIVTALAHSHDIQGRRKSARREDGTTWSYNYNSRSEVTGAEKRESNSDLVPGLDFGYNYDGLGNRLSARKGQPALVTTYSPDAMNRYSTIESPGADDILVRSATAVEIEVDEEPVPVTTSGNFRGARVTADDNTTGPAFLEINITGDNDFSESGHRWIPQAEFSPQYDDDGNLTNDGRWIYTWDAMNRLIGMTPTAAALAAGVPNQTLTFAYDHLGRRVAKKVTTTIDEVSTVKDYRYLYEGWNVVAQFTADTNNTLTPDATFLWSLDLSGTFHGAGGVGGLHSVNLYSGGQADKLCLAAYDANGNIIAWTDTTGRLLQRQDYDPFGNRVIRERLAITPEQSERLEYGFSTKPLDAETGLIYFIFRYYGPRHGQWMNLDPIGEAGGLNLYGFVGNDGVGLTDPLGLEFRMKIVGQAQAAEYDPMTKSFAFLLEEDPAGWKPQGVGSRRIVAPKKLATADGRYKTLTLFTVTGNGRPSLKAEQVPDPKRPKKLITVIKDPADSVKGIYTEDRGNAGFDVYLTQKINIVIDVNTGVITTSASSNEWEWYGPGPDDGDYIALGSILVVNQPEQKNKATFDYYGVGGWNGRQSDPSGDWKFGNGDITGQKHAEGKPANYATGPGFFPTGVPEGEFPDVSYSPLYPEDGHRHPGGTVNARNTGLLGKVSLSVECTNQ